MGSPILEVANLVKRFGGLEAVSDVSFSVSSHQIKAVIGPNGAGKTTMFNLITGLEPPTGGEITFKGTPLSGLKAHQIAALGISRTFQNVELYHNMSVLENVMVGRHPRTSSGMLSSALRLRKAASNADTDGLAGLQQLAGDATLLFYLTAEAKEGRDAFVEKRPPDFSPFPRLP